MPILLVLAARHPIFLDGLERLFRLQSGFRVVARCGDGAEAVAAVRRYRPDVLVLDTNVPPQSGLDVVRELRQGALATKVVLLAGRLQEDDVLEALRLGVEGMFLKDLASRLLVQCVRKVHAGARWLETQISARALDTLLQRESAGRNVKDALTPRELEVVRMAAGGLPCREMAHRLAISEGTVKLHLHNIYRKIKVPNRVGLARYALSKKLV